MLKNRPGVTLAEVMVALTMTAVIGMVMMGAFVSQSRFYDHQEKVGSARGVSRGAMNVMMSDLRMVEPGGGVVSASNAHITVRVPYALGMYCGINSGTMRVSRLPVDPSVLAEGGFSGYAYRDKVSGVYTYVEGGGAPTNGTTADCTGAGITVLTADGGVVQNVPSGTALEAGTPVFFYRIITYEFKASVDVPGEVALWRRLVTPDTDEELVAPFDVTAGFRFYVNDADAAQTAVPGTLSTITGVEIVLDAISERPDSDGSHQRAPLTTAVFFKNR